MTDHTKTILDMFSYCRPMGSRMEQQFIDRHLTPLGFERDKHQNLILRLGDKPRILFSSHVDTVHNKGGKQKLSLKDGVLRSNSNCLGADDTAGIWLMTEMVKAGIPGLYIIHHGEEQGCIGSTDIATYSPATLEGIDIAIAFDRAGYADIITHQMWQRTASDAFAESLAIELGGSYKACNKGAYTDTYQYAALIPECTNISVGYDGQHSSKETQDVDFLISLREALLQVNWDNLVVARDPADYEEERFSWRSPRRMSLEDWTYEYPRVAADILAAYGLTEEDFEAAVEDMYGTRAVA